MPTMGSQRGWASAKRTSLVPKEVRGLARVWRAARAEVCLAVEADHRASRGSASVEVAGGA